MKETISQELLENLESEFRSDRANRVAMNAVVNNGVYAAARNAEAYRTTTYEFSIRLEQGDITAQKSSGRCWMFAALNTMRVGIMKKLNLKTFEFSENYLLFYDKLERANNFLENILDTLDEPMDSRLMMHLFNGPVNDGGMWELCSNLVEKYGVVPKSAMPETISSSATGEMVNILSEKVRGCACVLRRMHAEGKSEEALREKKAGMMKSIYNMLCICLGIPPKTFDLELRDKDKNFIRDTGLTPKEFYDKYVGVDLRDYAILANIPSQSKPYYKRYRVKYSGNVREGQPIHYVNVPMEELKQAAIDQLKDGEAVWYACAVGQRSERASGLMDLNLYCFDDLFDAEFNMTKEERVEYRQSPMTHAMALQGVNLDENGKPNRWCVENSWGTDAGKSGNFVMTDEWFDEYGYEVVVHKKYLSEKALAAYENVEEEVLLDPWKLTEIQ